MRRLYELSDDVSLPGRWHLGEITAADGSYPFLDAGVVFIGDGHLTVRVSRPGRGLAFSLTSFAVPVATKALGEAIVRVAGGDVQCLSLNVAGRVDRVALNATRVVDCIDESRSEFLKWTPRDHRADLAGQYRQVTRLVIEASRVPNDAHFFRLGGWPIALVVSERVKTAMEEAGCRGAMFSDITPQG